jgi:hypothetical protein
VLAYLSRYTHRVAIANSRLIACDRSGITFRWKDYRAEGRDRQKVMTLATAEFIRRFLIHVLPSGFHRIRHYGLLASGTRTDNIAKARRLLDLPAEQHEAGDDSRAEDAELSHTCPCCGGRMVIIETFQRRLAALSAGRIHRRNQDRYIMIEVHSRRHPSAAPLYRGLLTGNDQARPRTVPHSRPVVRSLLRDAGSACRDWPTVRATPSTASQRGDQRSSATSRQRPNPHSV